MNRSLLAILFIALSSFLIPAENPTDLVVMKAAESQLPIYLEKIQPGNEAAYGFTGDDDLDGCSVGKPYRMITFNKDFYNDSKPEEEKNYISIDNEWRVPVINKAVWRALLTVTGNPGNYRVSDMGTPILARELQHKNKDSSENSSFYLLQVPSLLADFIVIGHDNSFIDAQFIPLESAIMAIPALSGKNTFDLLETEKIIKEALKKIPVKTTTSGANKETTKKR